MAVYTFTSNTNSVLVDVDGKQAAFGDKELHPYTPDRSGDVVYMYDLTGILKKISTPSTHQESNPSKDRIPLDITVDTIDVNGTNTWADAGALLDALRAIFFLASADSPLIPDSQRVNTFADLPDPVASDGQYWNVDQATGVWILGTRKESGIYKAVAGAWTFRGADVPYYLLDDQFTIKDGFDNSKQLGFEVNLVTPGQRRIATWQDKNITVADNADVVAGDTGSVTIHSDIDDPGSGEIITDQERTDINASVGVHSDVNLTGITLINETILKRNGSAFVPASVWLYRNPALLQNAANNSPITILNFQLNVQRLVTHEIRISFGAFSGANNRRVQVTATLDGSPINSGLAGNVIYDKEDKDVNDIYMVSKTFYFTPTTLGNNEFNMEFTRQGGGGGALASVWDTSVRIEEYFDIN